MASLTVGLLAGGGCSSGGSVKKEVRALERALSKGEAAPASVSGAWERVDSEAAATLAAEAGLSKVAEVREEAWIVDDRRLPRHAVRASKGWRWAENPLEPYSQATPRAALRSLVIATRMEDWEWVMRLAPRRYRVGMSPEKIERTWTEGPWASALQDARDRLAMHLEAPITVGGNLAYLAYPSAGLQAERSSAEDAAEEGKSETGRGAAQTPRATLEREGERWVVVDF